MQYKDKYMKYATDKIDFASVVAAVELLDVEGILAKSGLRIQIDTKGDVKLYSKNDKVIAHAPINVLLKDSIGDGDAGISLNQTIEIEGEVVNVLGEKRIDYLPIADAPVEIQRNFGKLWDKIKKAAKIVAAVAVAAAVVAVVGAIAVGTCGTGLAAVGALGVVAAKAAAVTVGGAIIGGAVTAGIGYGVQKYEDNKNGIDRHWKDYLYQGVDNFCTGAIISAPLATSWVLPVQLIGVGACSYQYQVLDKKLDEEYGSDFYDVDSNMVLNVIFDVALAGVGSKFTKFLNSKASKAISKLSGKAPKSTYIWLAKFSNKYRGTNYKTDWANINVLKKALGKEMQVVNGLRHFGKGVLESKWVKYLLLGGIDAIPGADVFTSWITDKEASPILNGPIDDIEEIFKIEEYDESYTNYSRITYDSESFSVIDFDEEGNLVFE